MTLMQRSLCSFSIILTASCTGTGDVCMLLTYCLFVVEQTDRGTEFRRSHHMVRKTTLYDMGVDPTCKYAAVGCQDRCIRSVFPLFKKKKVPAKIILFVSSTFCSACRIFNINSGKQKKLYKGSLGEDGSLIRVTFLGPAHSPFRYLHTASALSSLLYPHRYSLIRPANTWPPAAPTKTSASLISSPGNVWPRCLDILVTEHARVKL